MTTAGSRGFASATAATVAHSLNVTVAAGSNRLAIATARDVTATI